MPPMTASSHPLHDISQPPHPHHPANTLQKATKTLAAANTRRLNTTLYLTLATHTLFWVLRALLYRRSFTRRSLILYLVLSAPQLLINLQFERLSRPTYLADGTTIKRAGEDLDAAGLTEYLWDVTYWTYGCIVLAALFGDAVWWAMLVVPLYSAYALYGVYAGFRGGGGAPGYQDAAGVPQPGGAQSKRQAKMEKRGGQKVAYR